jgi:flagellar basal-body rod protein FlgB
MFLRDLTESGAIPALELTARFAARRQELLAHNIANATTPDFRPVDADPGAFQRMLGEAIDRRREGCEGLPWRETREIRHHPRTGLHLVPRTPSGHILFHDRNNRDLERMMADVVENVGVFRAATDMMRSRFQLISGALAERV